MTEMDPSLIGSFVFPASSGQERLWFLREFDVSGGAAYHLHGAYLVEGELDRLVLQRSLNQVVARHETLRTHFTHWDGRLVQVVTPGMGATVSTVDLTELPADQRWAEVERISEHEGSRPFQLGQGPLLRVSLLRLSAREHVLLVTLHHVIADGWSLALLVGELGECYEAFRAGRTPMLPELPLQYADYTAWQREWRDSAEFAEQRSYWLDQLADAPLVLELPADHGRPAIQSFRGAVVSGEIPRELVAVLRDQARAEGMTLYMVLLGAFQALLGRYTGQADFLVGTPVANRAGNEVRNLIGFFVNTVVLRADLGGDPTVAELLRRTRATCLDAFAHQQFPFEELVGALKPDRAAARNPIFQVLFAMEDDSLAHPRLGELSLRRLDTPEHTAKFDLSLFVVDQGDGVRLRVEHSTDLFDRGTIERLLAHYVNIVGQFARRPDLQLSALSLLSGEEREQALAVANGPELPVPPKSLPQLFEEQVLSTPDRLAVQCGPRTLTYRQLNVLANRIAHLLLANGVGAEHRVAVCLERVPELIATLLGILKTGAAYVPLDPRYPSNRVDTILRDARPTLLITSGRLLAGLPETTTTIVLEQADLAARPGSDPGVGILPHNLAYVLYTSGSTGTPKGVAIEHHSAANLVTWARTEFGDEELSRTVAATSVCFDLSVFEIFTPLVSGGGVTLVDNALSIAADTPASLINTVPSAIAELLDSGAVPTSAHTVNLAGEPLTARLIQRLHAETNARRVVNLYGPSETTTYSTFTELPGDVTDPVPIGVPVGNTQAHVLDGHLQPVPVGVVGELFLGGVGLARGYLGRAALTAERFVPDPLAVTGGQRLYRTGDLVRRDSGGRLEFVGRTDHQIKLRGYRIELGEIETVLKQHPDVQDAVVRPYGNDRRARQLIAYLVAGNESDRSELARTVRQHLATTLPHYMIPSGFVFLDHVPLTPNGKIDRAALPAPDNAVTPARQEYTAPRNHTEKRAAALVAELLDQEQVGVHDNFFELGGDSLLAGRLIQELRKEFHVNVPLREVFIDATVRNLAAVIESARQAGPTGGGDRMAALLDDMSDNELDSLLNDYVLDVSRSVGTAKEADL
jgi:amino acid adenylation domain-containing protein